MPLRIAMDGERRRWIRSGPLWPEIRSGDRSVDATRLHLRDGPHLDETAGLEDRAPRRKLDRLREVPRLDDHEADDDVLALGVGPVADAGPARLHDLARGLERAASMLDVTLRAQVFHPGDPLLRLFLPARRRRGPHAPTEQIGEFAHDGLPFAECVQAQRAGGRSSRPPASTRWSSLTRSRAHVQMPPTARGHC